MIFKEFNNPWSADNSEWYGGESNKWGIDSSFFQNNTKNKKRPSWNKVFEGYPKDESRTDDMSAEAVFTSILGDNYDRNTFTNACSNRVSLGLLNGGMAVKKDFIVQKGKFKGKGFIASAVNLKNWLSRSEVWGDADEEIAGPSDVMDVKKTIGEKKGIYIILGGFASGISGHTTLWIGDEKNAFGGNNYI